MRRITAVKTRTAYLVGPGKIKLINGQLAYSSKEQGPLRLDPNALERLYCYGDVGVTDRALTMLFHRAIQVSWHSRVGTVCYGRLARGDSSNASLRLLQHRALACPQQACALARRFVQGKIASQIEAARHYQRHGWLSERSDLALLRNIEKRVQGDLTGRTDAAAALRELDELRGMEGAATRAWFTILGQVLPPPWVFSSRQRRPPPDPINALLSLGYTLLLARVRSRLEAAGLEVNLGALHAFRPGRPSLACDVMEPLRTPTVDRWLVGLCRRERITPDQFLLDRESCRLQPAVFPSILASWEQHFQDEGGEELLEDGLDDLLAWIRSRQSAFLNLEHGSDDADSAGQGSIAKT